MVQTKKKNVYGIRTRFAPSPTGSLHIGGLRTALFNYMFAKRYGGDFILRIEDTDQKRYDENALRVLLESLQWAGLEHDEFYVQSERLDLYQEHVHKLVAKGAAYYCTCSAERLAFVAAERERLGHQPGYDGHCRPDIGKRAVSYDEALASPHGYVVRLLMPRHGYVSFEDAVRGEVEFKNNVYNDPILLKSDGFPTYHLAHVVDDHAMKISHVIRAQEWLPSTAIHLQLWDAFGWQRPVYAHLPVMLNPGDMKGKISKRNPPIDQYGNPIPVLVHDYIEGGYLPEAVLNFLCNTGWNFGRDHYTGAEREIFSLDEAIARFDLGNVIASNSKFPTPKLKWINGIYIRNTDPNEFVSMLYDELVKAEYIAHIEPYGFSDNDKQNYDYLRQIAPLIQPRIKTLLEGVELARPFFERPNITDLSMYNIYENQRNLRDMFEDLNKIWGDDWTAERIEEIMRRYADIYRCKLRDVCAPIRYALTGSTVSVPLFEMMEILGRDEVLARLEKVLNND